MQRNTAKIIIPLPLMTLNKFINVERTNRYKGAQAKRNMTGICYMHVKKAMNQGVRVTPPVQMDFTWYCKDRREDPDNIAFQRKFILDGMVMAGLLENDGWHQIQGFSDRFVLDKHERVEIILREART